MEEIWKDVVGYEDYYMVSSIGRVMSKDRMVFNGKEKRYLRNSQLLKPQSDSHGYLKIVLSNEITTKAKWVHRLVAEAFCEKPHGTNVVNHIDANPRNNYYKNLEWTTHLGNMQHASRLGLLNKDDSWKMKLWKPVVATNIVTGDELRFNSIKEAEHSGFRASLISLCCRGKKHTHKGYRWCYASGDQT